MMTRNDMWRSFGQRLRWAREKRRITKTDAARQLAEITKKRITRKHIASWELIESPEHGDKGTSRAPWPDEIVALVEMYGINGLWLFLYDREPALTPEPPEVSALYGHPRSRNPRELWLTARLRALSDSDISTLVDAVGVIRRI